MWANRSAPAQAWLPAGIGRQGFSLAVVLLELAGRVECYIRLPGREEVSKAAFHALLGQKQEIETRFGGPLDWQELPDRQGCRICKEVSGGWRSPEAEWPTIQDRMIEGMNRLESALRKPIQELKL